MVTLIVWAGATFVCTALIAGNLGWAPQTQANRTEGWFLNPNTAGTLCGALLCLSGPLSPRIDRSHLGWRSKLAGYAPFFASAILFTGLLLTRSRGALISTGLSLGGLIVLQGVIGRVKIKPILTSAAILLVLALIVVGIGGSVVDRAKTLVVDANLRHFIFYVHWKNFLAHPLRGYGLGSFDTVNRMTLTSGTFADLWNIRAAENVYLQWLVEAGVIGSSLMFSCIGIIVAVTVLGLKSSRTFSMLAIMLTVDSVFLIHGLFDFGLQTPSLELFWAFILGAQYSLANPHLEQGGLLSDPTPCKCL